MIERLKLYCNTNQLAILRDFLTKTLQGTGLGEIEKHQVILAVEEVCANLMIHSHACNPNSFINVSALLNEEEVIFEIVDMGQGFNILEYQEPELTEVVKTKRKGGLGIMLVKKIMDRIEFESNGQKNTCRLIKQLKSK
ncbi:ATP-binding protein [Cecembia calidifontis]|jgi:serine/threonine-protein kinase RsbW|uniref:Serine/threonine-protein kinase RsbW n=1 Tax=Cecembia calidifontis TaxID=1187080 RepID=A0A4Q7P4W9_9BACT|nr:ATP-binding protein [Cecembia calidifontis]RZS95046.1 serine/threonine-protein kinase RsbW [Cecembia calidifontis]